MGMSEQISRICYVRRMSQLQSSPRGRGGGWGEGEAGQIRRSERHCQSAVPILALMHFESGVNPSSLGGIPDSCDREPRAVPPGIAMLSSILFDLQHFEGWIRYPFAWIGLLFQIWMLVDAIRRQEYVWAVFILLFSVVTAALYYFFVYRQAVPAATRGFELPGAHSRQRIKELQSQIHHLDNAHHHSQLGDVYFQQGKLAKAETCYRAALERDAQDIDTRAHLGQCLLRQKRTAEARPLLEAVVAEDLKHDYGYSLVALGETYASLGQNEAAIQTFQRVAENHSQPRARVQLAELYLKAGQPEFARADLNEVVADDRHAPAFQQKRDRVWVRRAKKLLQQLP